MMVVILHENMRQKVQGRDDSCLQEALSNMQSKACTSADIAFLNTCITSNNADHSSMTNEEFCNVSIITAFNTHKDSINALGAKRFAAKTGQTLTDFYSADKLTAQTDDNEDKHQGTRKIPKNQRISSITDSLQCWLWDAPYSTVSNFIPGQLLLCLDMPIMIRINSATELCMMKGQEDTVYVWQSSLGS